MITAAAVALVGTAYAAAEFAGERVVQLQEEQGLGIYGTVMVTGSRAPVPQARVVLSSAGQVFGIPSEVGTVDADANGRFAFTGLEPGSYLIEATHPTNPERFREIRRAPFDIGGSQLPSRIEVWLEPLGRISGRVLDTEGTPVAAACVSLVKRTWGMGFADFEGGTGCESARDGVYELSRPVGKYLLRILSGPDATESFVTEFYPGVVRSAEAAPIVLRAGADVPLDIRLAEPDAFRVRFRFDLPGRLPGEDEPLSNLIDRGEPVLNAIVRPAGPDGVDAIAPGFSLEYLGDETWQTPPLPAGEYDLLLRYPALTGCMTAGDFGGLFVDCYPSLDPIGIYRIVLVDEDLDLGRLTLSPRVSLPGHLSFRNVGSEGSRLSQVPPLRFVGSFSLSNRVPSLSDDGTFVVDSLVPGIRYLLRIDPENLPDGWYLASARSGSQDILRDGLDVGIGSPSPIEVVMAGDGGQISGVVRRSDGTPVPEAQIIMIPPGQLRGPVTRLRAVVGDMTGAYSLTGVPPGQYRMLVVDPAGLPFGAEDYEDPEFLKEFEPRGQVVTVERGVRMTIDPEPTPLSSD